MCVCVARRMYVCVLGDSYCIKTFFTDVDVGCCVSISSSLTILFFFLYHNEIRCIVFVLSSSCHVMWYHVVLTSLPCVTKFFYHTFFLYFGWLFLSSCRCFKCSSYSSSHHTCHHTSSSVNFFFYYYHHSCCSVLLHITRGVWDCYGLVVDSLASVPPWNFVSKKSSRLFYDTRTHFAALARACFHESHVCVG
jgi:hypothetical protein